MVAGVDTVLGMYAVVAGRQIAMHPFFRAMPYDSTGAAFGLSFADGRGAVRHRRAGILRLGVALADQQQAGRLCADIVQRPSPITQGMRVGDVAHHFGRGPARSTSTGTEVRGSLDFATMKNGGLSRHDTFATRSAASARYEVAGRWRCVAEEAQVAINRTPLPSLVTKGMPVTPVVA